MTTRPDYPPVLTQSLAAGAALIALVVLGSSCRFLDRDRDVERPTGPSPFAIDPAAMEGADDSGAPEARDLRIEARIVSRTARRAALARGRDLYRAACATCHGARGDGNGPSAYALDPRPRDFTRGVFKWRSTSSGSLPLDEDLFHSISTGSRGTTMWGFGNLLSERERWELVEYVKSFSERFEEDGVHPDEIIPLPDDAPPVTAESLARGRAVYEEQRCGDCHGEDGRGDGPQAATLKDAWGQPSHAFDFTVGLYRGGGSDPMIYRTFVTGLDGTPMPSYDGAVAEEDRWPLVHYVRSLEREPGILERILFETP